MGVNESVGSETIDTRGKFNFIEIKFSNPSIVYTLGHCFSSLIDTKQFDVTPPPSYGNSMIWSIFKDETQLLIVCNGVHVLTQDFENVANNDCSKNWSPKIDKIRISNTDTASKCYRTIKECRFDPKDVSSPRPKLRPGTILPIEPGKDVTLYCDHDWFKLIGDHTLTCQEGGTFEDFSPPICKKCK